MLEMFISERTGILAMDNLTVELTLPRDLLGALDVPEGQLRGKLLELIAITLFRQEQISAGKAAELMGISKGDFIELLGQREIPYFTITRDELEAEVGAIERFLEQHSA
jgi:predicted HTH domain antitoxin